MNERTMPPATIDSKGPWVWAAPLDPRRLAILYLIGVSLALVMGCFFALAMRTELLTPQESFASASVYHQLFSMHGVVMVFLVALPAIPAVLGNLALPLLLGGRAPAWPRLSVLAWYLWLAGLVLAIAAMLGESLDTGWTFTVPFSTSGGQGVVLSALAVMALAASMLCSGAALVATIFTGRPAGMGLLRLPLFAWSLLVTGLVEVVVAPLLALVVVLLLAQRAGALTLEPVFFENLFWFWAHPALGIMVLPALGVVCELIGAGSGRRVFGYRALVLAFVAIGLLGFAAWGGHLPTGQLSPAASLVFSALILLASLPYAVLILSWMVTLYEGSIELGTGMCYALAFVVLFSLGGLAGIFLAVLPTAVHLQGTTFSLGQFHYIVVGGTLVAFLGGLHHWWPRLFGVRYNERWGRIGCALVFAGVNLSFFPLLLLGYLGALRRSAVYPERFQALQVTASAGAYLLGAALVVVAVNLLASLLGERRAGAGEASP